VLSRGVSRVSTRRIETEVIRPPLMTFAIKLLPSVYSVTTESSEQRKEESKYEVSLAMRSFFCYLAMSFCLTIIPLLVPM